MKLTIEELSKRTKLSIPTLRVYVSRQKLGTKVGNNRFFSQVDVDKLMKGSKRGGARKPAKAAKAAKAAKSSPPAKTARKKTAARKAVRKPVVPSKPVAAPAPQKPELKAKPARRSFWSRLFGGRKQTQKISLMDAKKS
jgi:hypothetical protein